MAVEVPSTGDVGTSDDLGGWRVLARFTPVSASVRLARAYVDDQLAAAGLQELCGDAGLVASELAANAVLHARTDFDLALSCPRPHVVRVEVTDADPRMPTIAERLQTAMSGRGMVLVAALALRWGVEPRVDGPGKSVWVEVGLPRAEDGGAPDDDDPSADDLVALWADLGAAPTVVVPDLPVRELLAAKEHMDDLVRELQLVMHDPAVADLDDHHAPDEVRLARRLDAAVHAFDSARRQVRSQVVRAAREGLDRVTLELVLSEDAALHASRYRDAIDDAEALARRGGLLTRADELGRHAAVRRRYLDAVTAQLSAG